MKTPYTFLLAMVLGWALQAQTVPVTFSVDMSNEAAIADSVCVAGNFQGWNAAGTVLTDDDMDGVFTVTVDVPETLDTIQYKFLNGPSYDFQEPGLGACGVDNGFGGFNRAAVISDTTALDTVCFGQCGACGTSTILFQVDMSQEEAINPSGVFMLGSFAGFAPTDFIMMDDADGDLIYTHVETVDGSALPEMDTVRFKFSNGDSFTFNENPEGDCADEQGFRTLVLDGSDMVYEASAGQAHCFDQCGSCVAPTPVTFRVDMSTQDAVSVNGVSVAGSFQGWSPGVNILTDDDGDMIYETTIEIAPGDYQFKFVNGNDWGTSGEGNLGDESPPGECVTGGNRVVSVGTDPITVQYCYNQCSETCVANPDPATITFKVDMGDTTVNETGVWLIGSFTSPQQWQAGALQLSDSDGDNVYEVEYEVSGPAFFEYRFCNGDPYPDGVQDDSVAEVGDFAAGGCGQANPFGEFNRTHVRSGVAEDLGPYCYGSCLSCEGDTVVIGIEEVQDFIGLEAFPNPAEDVLNIRFDGVDGLADIRVFDLSGQVVLSERTRVVPGMVTTYGTESFRPGIYILEVRNGLRRSTLRLTVK